MYLRKFMCGSGAVVLTIARLAGGTLVMSGILAGTAAAQGVTEVHKGGTASAVVNPADHVGRVIDWQGISYVGVAPPKPKDDEAAKETKVEKTSAASEKKKKKAEEDLFRPDPQYQVKYDPKANVDIYGAKVDVDPPRPLLELGRQQYTSGGYDESSTLFGALNPLLPGLSIYGDWRTAVAYNRNGGRDIAQVATRLNLDVDFKITATERIHAFFTPLQRNNTFTRFEFGGGDGNGKFNDELDAKPQTLFFEGDLGSIYSGISGSHAGFDLPFTVGLFPLFLQNGIWANDAILGGAFSLPAKNSAKFGLPNFDVTVFAAFDQIDNKFILGERQRKANLFGVTTFIDAFKGYVEAGYAMIEGGEGLAEGRTTHFVTGAYTRRFANMLSNSTRVFANFGNGIRDEGVAIISENSFVTRLPSTLIPYANFFIGFGNPQPLVDGNGAGLLKNVGINFETDALTGYPKLNDTGSNAWGGAIGLQYLFNFDQQLLFEVATVQPFGDPIAGVGAPSPQYGFGMRYQIALSKAWLFRADATYQITEGAQDNFGIRAEMRRKF